MLIYTGLNSPIRLRLPEDRGLLSYSCLGPPSGLTWRTPIFFEGMGYVEEGGRWKNEGVRRNLGSSSMINPSDASRISPEETLCDFFVNRIF